MSDDKASSNEGKLKMTRIGKGTKTIKIKTPIQENKPQEENKSQANRLGFVIGLQNELSKSQ